MTQRSVLHLRDATIADAPAVADLDSAVTPDSLSADPQLVAFWWTHPMGHEASIRLVSERDGAVIMYASAIHQELKDGARFGVIRVRIHPEHWTEDSYLDGVDRAEQWLRAEGVETAVMHLREDIAPDLRALTGLGYREVRRSRVWQLDLVRGRERLLAGAETCRVEMKRQGVWMLTLDQDADPDNLRKLYELDLETTEDVPKTVPWPVPTFDEWREHWLDHPGHRNDRFWIAREAEAIVGLSIIGYPPVRGIPWTAFTCTARSVRGRGIARALKYQTVAQAIELGVERVRTDNDAENAPILHLNDEMGYEPVSPVLELHRDLRR